MSNQENNQKQIQFPAQQELKHLRTRCGKVYALGNNRFRAVVQTTPVHEYDAATHQWVELSAEKRQQMAAQAHSPIATFADNTNDADNFAGILDTYVKEGSTQNFSHDERLWISNTNYYGNRLTYLKVVDLPRLGANHFITSAKLCVRNVYAPTADTAIMCKEVLKDWDPETITYDHQPDVSGVYQDYCRVVKNQYSWKEFDVTSLARKWYLGDNHGVQLSAPESESSFSQLHSSETANQPYFVLEYASLAGLESYLTYDHQSAGLAGTGSVSLVNGNLIFAHADTAMNGNRLPVSVTHYYNSCDSDKDEFGMGYGWRTSLHQTLHKVLYNGEVEFVYTDGDGTEHFFKKNDSDQKKYSDQSGLSLTLEIGDENITITDKGDNVMTFPLVSDTPTEDAPETGKALIQKIQDAVGNEVTVTALAGSPLKIASVTDGANRVTTLHYTDDRCDRIQTPWQNENSCVCFNYYNEETLYITHEDGRMSKYEYALANGYHLLVSASAIEQHVENQEDKKLADVTYEYSNTNAIDGLPHCITHATVTGTKNGTTLTAANVSYTYGNHMALVKDEISGKTLRYHFNDDGNQVSVDDELGYAMYTRYDRTDDNANAPINHATERSRMQRVVRNLLLDPMCEENSSVWEKSSTGTITRDQSTRQFGLVSYRLTIWSSDCVYVRQAVTLTPGKSYTLSGYVRSGGPRGVMRVAYTVGNETFTLDSEPGKVWKKTDNMPYERVSVSFTLPENAEPKVYCMAYCDMQNGFAGGNCWFDAMQLEEGLTLNHFNMVQNSDFSVTGTDGKPKAWTIGKNDASYVEVLPLDAPKDEFHAPDCLKHDNTQKIRLAGRYDRTVTYYQQFRHYGKIGDRFTVGGWCSSFAKKNDPDNYIYCRIAVLFTAGNPDNANCYWATGGSAVFNAEEGNWQFASAGIVAPNNCTYIRVVLQMNRQMNFADFTGIYLYPEAFGTQYIYDKNGNRKTRKMLYGGQEKSEFDDADNLTKHTAAGRTVSSTFHYGDTEEEQKKHLLLKSIAPLGSVSTFTYDAFGNPLTSQVQNAEENPSYFIRGETTYTDDGNYVTEQKDARGKIVRTEIDPQRGTTTSVTDAKGQTVEYKYDELRRIVKTSANVGAEEGILTAHNEYTYDAQRGNLVEIRHNTDGNVANDVVYTFEQDELGRQTAVKVGNQTLSQSQYQNDLTKPNFGTLTATTYGNGAKISSRYDDFNRVTGVVYGEETAPRYEYDYNAKGQVARVRDNLLNRTTQSEYDLANRPVRVKTSEDAKHVYTGQVAYDNVYGNLSEFTEKVGENRQEFGTKFGYDDENRPTSLTYSASGREIGQSTMTIDKLNRTTFSAVKLGSKTFTSEYHFAAGGYGTGSVTNLVSSITQPGCNCGYGYDDNGNIASATLNGKWTGYTYDELGQLIQVNDHSDTRSGENGTTWKYTYDLGGNILKKERFAYADTTNPLETVTYTYGDANWRDKLTAVNGSTIRYDAIGNPLNDGTWTYTWQNGRQLQKMQKAGVTAEFVYNADGLRVQKTVNGVATKYTLHGKNIVHMTSGTDELHFFYDAQNKPAVVIFNGIAYAYLYDLQGDVIGLVDNNGTQMVSYTYDAWGKMLSKTGTLASTLGTIQPFRYRGYALDEETELYYNQSRFYNPSIARFITADTTGVLTASLKSLTEKNLFAYCDNNPVMRKDIDGAFWDTFFDIVSLAVSVCEVIANPTDPWAWAGLAGDVVDLVPFVTGVGEVTRAVKAANKAGDVLTIQKAADFTDDAADIIKGLDRSSGFTKSTRSAGTQIHKGYKVGMPGKEYDKIKGIRIDYLDMDNKVIYELKPFNPRSVKQGVRQLEKYNQKLDGGYKMVLEVY
ncbi:MAG: DNRLRE domain-containing protein [Lachnospiraceae bacterium]